MKRRRISVTEYAKEQGITRQAALKRIWAGRVPGVIRVEKIGATYALLVPAKVEENNIVQN